MRINGHDEYCLSAYPHLIPADTCHYCNAIRAARADERRQMENP